MLHESRTRKFRELAPRDDLPTGRRHVGRGTSDFVMSPWPEKGRPLSDLHGLGFLWAVPGLRRMGSDTVNAGALALDYLSQHPAVDREKIILLGVSSGSVFTTVVGGLDERAKAIVLIYGGCNLPALAQNAIRNRSSWTPSWLIQPLVRLFFGASEPLDHVGEIASRYLLMIHSRQDELFPPALATALYERARDPEKLIWYETGDMDLFEPTLIRKLTSQVVKELRAAGYLCAFSITRTAAGPAGRSPGGGAS